MDLGDMQRRIQQGLSEELEKAPTPSGGKYAGHPFLFKMAGYFIVFAFTFFFAVLWYTERVEANKRRRAARKQF